MREWLAGKDSFFICPPFVPSLCATIHPSICFLSYKQLRNWLQLPFTLASLLLSPWLPETTTTLQSVGATSSENNETDAILRLSQIPNKRELIRWITLSEDFLFCRDASFFHLCRQICLIHPSLGGKKGGKKSFRCVVICIWDSYAKPSGWNYNSFSHPTRPTLN